MRYSPLAMVVVCVLIICSRTQAQDWKPLFNGKNLEGWDTYLGVPHPSVSGLDQKKNERGNYTEPVGLNKDPKQVFTVVEVDGAPAIRISGEIYGALTTREEFENYHLRLEVKWGERRWAPRADTVRDSGLLYHCVGPHGAGSGAWMRSFESQIQENDFGDFWSVDGVIVDVEGERQVQRGGRGGRGGGGRGGRGGGRGESQIEPTGPLVPQLGPITFQKGGELFTGWTDRIIRNPLSEKPHGEWNTVELYAVGPTSVHVNNGQTNMILTNLRQRVEGEEKPLTKGKLQLQSEAAEVYYRNIEIRPIDKIPDEVLLLEE